MRVTSNYIHDVLNQLTQRANVELSDAMIRMTSEKRILRPSDDPVGAVRLAQLSQSNTALEQYHADMPNIMRRLKLAESSLTILSSAFVEARSLLVKAADGTPEKKDQMETARELVNIRDQMLQFSLAHDSDGHYLFSGTAVTTAPIAFKPSAAAGTRYAFVANTEAQLAVIGDGVTEIVSDNLKGMETVLNKLDVAIEQLASGHVITEKDEVFEAVERTDALVTSKIGRLGNAQNTLTMFDNLHVESQIAITQAAQDVGKIDRNEVYDTYMSYRTALEATQKVYAHVSQLSLFNIL